MTLSLERTSVQIVAGFDPGVSTGMVSVSHPIDRRYNQECVRVIHAGIASDYLLVRDFLAAALRQSEEMQAEFTVVMEDFVGTAVLNKDRIRTIKVCGWIEGMCASEPRIKLVVHTAGMRTPFSRDADAILFAASYPESKHTTAALAHALRYLERRQRVQSA